MPVFEEIFELYTAPTWESSGQTYVQLSTTNNGTRRKTRPNAGQNYSHWHSTSVAGNNSPSRYFSRTTLLSYKIRENLSSSFYSHFWCVSFHCGKYVPDVYFMLTDLWRWRFRIIIYTMIRSWYYSQYIAVNFARLFLEWNIIISDSHIIVKNWCSRKNSPTIEFGTYYSVLSDTLWSQLVKLISGKGNCKIDLALARKPERNKTPATLFCRSKKFAGKLRE